jgi:hypothetical protein
VVSEPAAPSLTDEEAGESDVKKTLLEKKRMTMRWSDQRTLNWSRFFQISYPVSKMFPQPTFCSVFDQY